MAQITADFELGTNGNTIAITDPGSATPWDVVTISGAGALTYDVLHPGHGLLSANINPQANAACFMSWTTALGTVTDHFGRFYIYLIANPASFGGLLSLFSGASLCFRIGVNSSGQIRGDDNTGTAYTFTNAITLNQLVRVEYHVIHSTTVGQHEIKLFNTAESTVATETNTSAANRDTQANGNDIHFGVGEGGLGQLNYWMDDIVANATSYPGPVVEVPVEPILMRTTISPLRW